MLPRAQKGDKFPRPFVQRRLLFSDEKKGSKFTRLFLLKTLRMTNSHRFKIFPRILPFPLHSVHRLPNFPSFFFIISFSLFIFIDSRSQSNARYQDRQCATMRQPATFTVPLFWLKRGDLPKYRVLSRLGRIVSDTRPGHAATVYFPGQVGVKNEAAKPIRVLLSSPLPLPPWSLADDNARNWRRAIAAKLDELGRLTFHQIFFSFFLFLSFFLPFFLLILALALLGMYCSEVEAEGS